jgi:hypothetical protein
LERQQTFQQRLLNQQRARFAAIGQSTGLFGKPTKNTIEASKLKASYDATLSDKFELSRSNQNSSCVLEFVLERGRFYSPFGIGRTFEQNVFSPRKRIAF